MRNALIMLTASASLTALLAAGCSHPRVEGYTVPPAHRECGSCHVYEGGKALLSMPEAELCASCHMERIKEGEHRVGVKPRKENVGLPLLEGKVACISCHEPHGLSGQPSLLRTGPEALCQHCHDK
jgi:predicted CXXCH cytochrome family protein